MRAEHKHTQILETIKVFCDSILLVDNRSQVNSNLSVFAKGDLFSYSFLDVLSLI